MNGPRETPAVEVQHNPAQQRFEVQYEGQLSVLTYEELPGKMVLLHTEVPAPLRARGIASRLAKVALDFAGEHHRKVVPRCPFVAEFIRRHPEYSSIQENIEA